MAGILVGAALSASSFALAIAALAFVAITHYGVILPEERYLRATLGSAYSQ